MVRRGKKGTGDAPAGGSLDRGSSQAVPGAAGLVVGDVESGILAEHQGTPVDDLLRMAAEAESDYDYERALQLLRLAALSSGGRTAVVQPLAQFLVETYALYDEAIDLLRSPSVRAESEGSLRRLLADALFLSGRGLEALPLYDTPIRGEPARDAAVWTRIGVLREQAGNDPGARQAWQEALRIDPAARVAAQHLERVDQRLAGAAAERLGEARAAIATGHAADARRILEDVLAGPGDHREAAVLMREIEASARAERLAALESAAGASTDPAEALDRWRELLSLAPEHETARQAVPRLEHLVACRHFEERLDRGRRAVEEDRLEDAIHAFYRAVSVKPAEAEPPAELPGRHLYDVTSEFVAEVGARQLERVAPALAALCRAESALAAGDATTADTLVREAAPALGSFRRLDALRERLNELGRERTRQRALEALEDAERSLAGGDRTAAVEAFERAATLGGAELRAAAERAEALRAAIRRDEDERRLTEQLRRLEEEARWFELRRTIDRASIFVPDDPEVAELRARAEEEIALQYPVSIGPPPFLSPEAWGRCLDSRSLDLPDLDRAGTRVLRSPDGSRLLVLSGPLLVVVDTDRLAPRLQADLSPSVSFGLRGELVLTAEHPRGGLRVAVVSEKEATLLLLRATDGTVEVEERHDIGAILPVQRDQSLRYYALHGPTDRLVQLETRRNSNGPSALRNLSLADGRIVHDERYNYGLWNLLPHPRSDLFVVNRVVDFAVRHRPGYFTFALIDHRGRLVRRVHLSAEEVHEPMERIHSIARAERLDRLYLTYDYYDPLGNVVRQYPALMVLKGESEVFYQSPAPEKLLSGKRLPKGTVRVVEPDDGDPLLVLPHTDVDGRTGISVLGAEDLKLRFEIEFEDGETLHSLHETGGGRGLVAVTFPSGDGSWRVRRLDPSTRAWVS
jgi:tetratricopeptide (TPR) repeat protein